ncbi:hypothetical protein [Priestia koreensis]|nr:hypothetical protein [Priestia koreensis]UNL86828.1 hypothetical protein IE339_10185 [Priestia koreensis]
MKQEKNNTSSSSQLVSKTDAQKVKQEIQQDVNAGQGAMTSREAGSMHK